MTALSFFPLSNIKIIISDKMEMFRARARWLHWHKNWKQLFPSLTFLVTWNILQKNRNNNNCRHGWVLVKTRHLLLLQPPLIDFYLTDGSWTKNTHHTLCNLWITTLPHVGYQTGPLDIAWFSEAIRTKLGVHEAPCYSVVFVWITISLF